MKPKVSVIIGFRNWGLDRLLLSISSIHESLKDIDHEIVISDFGSDDWESNRRVLEDAKVKYVYSASSRWSRSRALNAGIAESSGDVVMCTDADMIFSPGSLQSVYEFQSINERSVSFIQCRDLPEEWDAPRISNDGWQWEKYTSVATLRPRWGMGGLVSFQREQYDSIRGFDERMHTYGGEDLDFAQRMQRAGLRAVWIEDPTVRMYHIWHPSSRTAASLDEFTNKAVNANTAIVEKDPTIIRNLTGDCYFRPRNPLVSVVISTWNRGDLIAESISSVLAQTFQDFELIIVDDGSTDNTRDVVNSFHDERIHYAYQENGGISKARNLGTQLARGKYIAVHDDDDLMLPSRLVSSLRAVRAGVRATFGSWVNFSHETGELALNVSRKSFDPNVIWGVGPAPGHSTWLVEKSLMSAVKYDEALSSAVDHNLATRLAMSGVKWAHCGAVLYLRRKHDRQISESDEKRQSGAAVLTRNWVVANKATKVRHEMERLGKAEPWPRLKEKKNLQSVCTPWLSDHQVVRTVIVQGDISDLIDRLESSRRIISQVSAKNTSTGEAKKTITLHDVRWRDLAELRRSGLEFEVQAVLRSGDTRPSINEQMSLALSVSSFVSHVGKWYQNQEQNWIVVGVNTNAGDDQLASVVGVAEVGRSPLIDLKAWAFDTEDQARRFERSIKPRKDSLAWIFEI